MLVSFKEFEQLVRSDVGSVAIPEIVKQARNAAIEFCEESRCWKSTAGPVDVLSGEAFYVIGYDESLEHLRAGGVTDVSWRWEGEEREGKRALEPKTTAELKEMNPLWKTKEGDPRFYYVVTPLAVRVWPVPSETKGELSIGLFMKPSRAATQCPEFLLETYGEKIAHGIKARILSQPGKDWFSPDLAEYHRRLFERAITTVRSSAATSGTGKALVGKPVRNAYFG